MKGFIGTPFTGYLQLTNGSLGPTAIPITVTRASAGNGNYTLQTGEVLCITTVCLTTNDTATPLITVDDGAGASLTKILSAYVSTTSMTILTAPPGCVLGRSATALRATASAITAAKTVEICVSGFIFKP